MVAWVTADLARLLICTAGCLTNYAFLVAVVPLWAASGGANEAGAGATTGVFMASTVGAQFLTPAFIRRFGYRRTLLASALFMGLPTPLYALTAALPPLLAISAVRGIGFGFITVTGSALVVALVPANRRGQGVGLYGVSTGLPNLVGLAGGVWIAQWVGYAPLFWAVAVLALGMVFFLPRLTELARTADTNEHANHDLVSPPPAGQLIRRWHSAWMMMISSSLVAGGFITFVPLAAQRGALDVSPDLIPVALLVFSACSTVGRWLTGVLSDRWGAGRVMVPAAVALTLGMVGYAYAVEASGALALVLAIVAALFAGAGFGAAQNDTLVVMFNRVDAGADHQAAAATTPAMERSGSANTPQPTKKKVSNSHDLASAAWNIAFDAGTGLGASVLGLVIGGFGYAWGFGFAAIMVVIASLTRLSDRAFGQRLRHGPRTNPAG